MHGGSGQQERDVTAPRVPRYPIGGRNAGARGWRRGACNGGARRRAVVSTSTSAAMGGAAPGITDRCRARQAQLSRHGQSQSPSAAHRSVPVRSRAASPSPSIELKSDADAGPDAAAAAPMTFTHSAADAAACAALSDPEASTLPASVVSPLDAQMSNPAVTRDDIISAQTSSSRHDATIATRTRVATGREPVGGRRKFGATAEVTMWR